ncbi:mitochondrial carrier protein [Coprinopsis cinerea okayama7|uniref:Small ribosomal subunit protein mS29 n=1 Tax=Coprinopsis cinerea (strain Okayama-7 / 130 / ATCC MYA-4618 / FGSC 9003) TaxID=240176 RepID=A8NAJ1_COPC7|nr:mitochondrial carrier protein [Coprinopsis cinerea okayama7\|eukprot:XP_001831843.1 mitochondrial carrier protein [Coprinopsis cinerea okayama7\
MSLLSFATGSCSSQRHTLHKSLTIITQQTRGAAQNAKQQPKKAQSIGGVKKGQKEKWEAKIAQERVRKSRDLPVFTKMPEERLKTPKTDSEPAFLNDLFLPGSKHALELPKFKPTPKNIGTVAGFDLTPTNPAKVFGLPKKMFLEFRIMSKPCSVIRDVTVDTIQKLESARNSSSLNNRLVLSGRAGCGKSYLLHQAVQYATEKGWIVFYIPRAVSLVNSTTPHVYDLRTQTYLQPYAAHQAVQKLLTVNADALSKLTLSSPIVTDKLTFEAGKTLAEVAGICVKDKSYASAPVVLDGLLKELEKQTEYPVLMAIDDFQSMFHKSAYKDPFFSAIKSFHLSMPRLILEFASGKRSFAKGAFIGALTASDTTFTIPLELRDALSLGYAHPPSPYDKRSKELLGYTQGLKTIEVPERFSVSEASSLFEMWKDDMALTSRRYDELFMSKYVESDGNPRDFVWKGLLSTFTP